MQLQIPVLLQKQPRVQSHVATLQQCLSSLQKFECHQHLFGVKGNRVSHPFHIVRLLSHVSHHPDIAYNDTPLEGDTVLHGCSEVIRLTCINTFTHWHSVCIPVFFLRENPCVDWQSYAEKSHSGVNSFNAAKLSWVAFLISWEDVSAVTASLDILHDGMHGQTQG